ncbi:hypothetical protein Sjap_005472 [Stephania japonica]|uniref:TAP42-like protein n=1 Tax=Stephania japonica TaxID=461633 RepID=A0AAP0PK41_9MAGN
MGEWKIDEEMPLPALFVQSRKIHSMASESALDQETLRKGCEGFRRCEEMIGKIGLFSANETKEDISTTYLKYLLIEEYAQFVKKLLRGCVEKFMKSVEMKIFQFCIVLGLAIVLKVWIGEFELVSWNSDRVRGFKTQKFVKRRDWSCLMASRGLDESCDKWRKGCESSGGCLYYSSNAIPSRVQTFFFFISSMRKHYVPIAFGYSFVSMISVPFYLAELTEKLAEKGRIQVLKISQEKLKEFISSCETMELVPKEELELAQGPNTPTALRAKKIARFKRQRAAESKLQEIEERKERRGRSTKAAALDTPVEAGEEDLLEDDGEEEREAWLTTISLAICKAFDLLEMLKKEEDMLYAMKEKQSQEGEKGIAQDILDERLKTAEDWHRNAAARARFTKPAQPITCATFAQDVLEGRANVSQAHDHKHQPLIFGPASLVGGNLTTQRERMAAQVFQPGHRLPTMSIEEAGLREMDMMNKWQERNAKLMEEANSSWHRDPQKQGLSDEDDDAAQEKARAWDDWKDDNPRGAGNKKLTPCG